jgi:hypothetical protein
MEFFARLVINLSFGFLGALCRWAFLYKKLTFEQVLGLNFNAPIGFLVVLAVSLIYFIANR